MGPRVPVPSAARPAHPIGTTSKGSFCFSSSGSIGFYLLGLDCIRFRFEARNVFVFVFGVLFDLL